MKNSKKRKVDYGSKRKDENRKPKMGNKLLKWYDEAFTATQPELTGAPNQGVEIGNFGTVAAGSGPSQRLGRQINIKKVLITWTPKVVGFSTPHAINQDMYVKLVIFVARNNNAADGSAINFSDIYSNTDSRITFRTRLLRNLNLSSSYHVLTEKWVRIKHDDYEVSGSVYHTPFIKVDHPEPIVLNVNIPVRFGATSDLGLDNQLYWMIISDNNTTALETEHEIVTRIRFEDDEY